jgi:uncharacterized protein (TIGR03067 family)
MQSDLNTLQGTWFITSLEVDGRESPSVEYENWRLVVKGNQFTSSTMGTTFQGRIELEASAKPKTFDLVFTSGPQKGTRNLGIYELKGDHWRLCLAMRGDNRPRTFKTKAGSGLALETLSRENAKTRKIKAKTIAAPTTTRVDASPTSSATELEGEWAMVSGVFNGVPMDQAAVKWCKRITRGNITRVIAGPQVFLNARFTLQNDHSPRSIDYLNIDEPNKGKSQAGIFELTDGRLSVCMSAPGKRRPGNFSSKPGDGRSFTVWQLLKR